MALSYDITKCTPNTFQNLNDQNNHWTLCVIMAVIGIGMITEENVDEVYKRVHALETLKSNEGGVRQATDREAGKTWHVEFTLDEIRRFIGMTTNIFPGYTNRQWWAKYRKMQKEELNATRN
jgi:hypothetical protein